MPSCPALQQLRQQQELITLVEPSEVNGKQINAPSERRHSVTGMQMIGCRVVIVVATVGGVALDPVPLLTLLSSLLTELSRQQTPSATTSS